MLAEFSKVIEAVRRGEMVIMVDDEDRENEGDLIIASECLTPEAIAFMMREGRGLICVTILEALAAKLKLVPQAERNGTLFGTAFTVSIDHLAVGNSGVTAKSRCATIKNLLLPEVKSSDFISPGHVFPLIAHPAGVLGRMGQTEGSLDLARLAGFQASAVICEILADDGSMLRGEGLVEFGKEYGLLLTSVRAVREYRISRESVVREVSRELRKTPWGVASARVFMDDVSQNQHVALLFGEDFSGAGGAEGQKNGSRPVVTIEECLPGHLYGIESCGCSAELRQQAQKMSENEGILIYLGINSRSLERGLCPKKGSDHNGGLESRKIEQQIMSYLVNNQGRQF